MAIKPIKRSNISNQVFEQLKQSIITKEWAPGTKIPSENELSAMLHVSRISVREALHKLESLGLIEPRHGEGTFIKELSSALHMNQLIPMMYLDEQDLINVLETRKILETECAKLAAIRANEEDIDNLSSILEKMKLSKKNNDEKRFSEEDIEFHIEITKMSKNPIVIKMICILQDILRSSYFEIVAKIGPFRGAAYHEEIFNAIKVHDAELAGEIMASHLESAIRAVIATESDSL
jgi:GntR family transcriptional repressor for pyruvate dehydrogenase complex